METVKTYNLTVASNDQAALLRAIGSIIETGASVTINKVANVPEVEEVPIRKYFAVGDVKGVDIFINTSNVEEFDYLKTEVDKAVIKAKECCKKPAAFFVTKLDYSHVRNLYLAIRPTTEEEAKAVNAFLSMVEELKSLHPGRVCISPIFNL